MKLIEDMAWIKEGKIDWKEIAVDVAFVSACTVTVYLIVRFTI